MVYSYLITDGKLYKIGKSENPEKRIRGLAQGNPSYRLLGTSDKIPESKLHKKYRSKKVSGEWFDLSPKQVDEILKSMETGELNSNNDELFKKKKTPKFNEFERDFYARVKKENGRLEKNENGTILLIHKDGGIFTPELLTDFPKCDTNKLWMVQAKSRDNCIDPNFLTPEQKKEVERLWHEENIQDLNVLTQRICGDPKVDGRNKYGRAIRQFLASKEFNYKTITIERVPEIILTEDQLSFIKSNFRKKSILEISQELFGEDIVTLSQEYKTVDKKIQEFRFKMVESMMSDNVKNLEDFEDSGKEVESNSELPTYNPPKTMEQVVSRINKYINLGWKSTSLRKEQVLWCESLMKYMRTFSFVRTINDYKTEENRMIFEDRFIRYCHDKPNLTHEDLDVYILLCAERVNVVDAAKRLEEARVAIDEERAQSQTGRVSDGSAQLLAALQRAYTDGCKREKDYLSDLTTLRSTRLEKQKIDSQISIIHLYKAFQDKKFRDQQARLGQIEHERLADETKKLGTISDMMAVIRGISVEELLGDDDL